MRPNQRQSGARTRFFRLAMVALVVLASLEGGHVHAQPSRTGDAIARAHFAAATGYFDTGNYESALREFEHAYELTQYPGLLYNLYLCHERLAQLEQASVRLDAYLASGHEIDNREALEERLANLRRRSAAAQTRDTTAPDVLSTDTSAAPTPRHPEPDSPEVVDTAPRRSRRAPWAIAAWSVGGVGLVTFATGAILARIEDGRLADSCGRNAGRVCSDSDVTGLRRRSLTADIGLGVAAAGGVAGLVLFLIQDRDAPVDVSAGIYPAGGNVIVTGRF